MKDRASAELLLEDLSWLRSLARSLVRDPLQADDAVQETIVTALTRGPRSVDDRGRRRGWLGTVLRNAIRQEQRGASRRAVRERRGRGVEDAPSTLEVVEELSVHRRLVEIVHELDEPYRTAIVMRFLRSQTPKEIARELAVPAKTVHTRIERGLERLRARLDRDSGGERRTWIAMLLPLLPTGTGSLPFPEKLWPAGLELGSVVIPMKLKLTLAVAALVALGALVLPRLAPEASSERGLRSPAAPLSPGEARAPRAGTESPALFAREAVEQQPAGIGGAHAEEALALVAPALVHGKVCDMEGRPVAGVLVTFEAERGDRFVPEARSPRAGSGADGAFELPLPRVPGRLTVADPDYAGIVRPYLDGTPPPEAPVVVVAPRREYSGRVVDANGGAVEGARVELTLDGDWLRTFEIDQRSLHVLVPFAEVVTDAFGAFDIEGVGFVAGTRIVASRDGFSAARSELPEHSTHDIELVLRAAEPEDRAVFGVVLDANGTPVADAHVSLGQAAVASGVRGEFGLELESWEQSGLLQAVKPGLLPASHPFEWSAAGEGCAPDRPLTLYLGDAPLSIRGRVIDANGEPVSGARVWTPDTTYFGRVARDMGGQSIVGESTVEALLLEHAGPRFLSVHTATDASGMFELGGLTGREYRLFAMAPWTLATAEPLAIGAGADDVELVLEASDGRPVAGRVVSLSGIPLPDVRVALGRNPDPEPADRAHPSWSQSFLRPPSAVQTFHDEFVVTDAEGSFAFERVQVEGAFLSLRGSAIVLGESYRLDPGEDLEAIEIVVNACCRIRVVLDDPEEADAFGLVDASGQVLPLFVRVETHVISTPRVDILAGRSGVAETEEGERTIVLFKEDTEVRRLDATFAPGGIQEVRP